ncbi:MAG: hypothetical protein ACO1QS_20505 [Verrucomicrobiota bacterium]
MITAREKRPALGGYAVVFLFAVAGAALFARLGPSSQRAVRQFLPDGESWPAGYRLFLNLQNDLWMLPVAVLVLGLLSWRLAFLRHHISLALISTLVGGILAACGALMATPYFMFAGLPALPLDAVGKLQTAQEITLYSLEPTADRAALQKFEQFHGIPVLGKTTITDAALKQTVIDAILEATINLQGSESPCFIPRHGLKIVSGGKITELSLCFECAKLELHSDGGYYSLARRPQPLLNRILIDAGVPLPIPASDGDPAEVGSNSPPVSVTGGKTN